MELLIATAVGLVVMMVVHEAGHAFAANRLGVAIREVAIGFGPRVGRLSVGGQSVSVRVVPLGGYVSFFDLEGEPLRSRSLILAGGPAANVASGLAAAPLLCGAVLLFGTGLSLAGLASSAVVWALVVVSVGSVANGLANLLPLGPLDGWGLLMVFYEWRTGRAVPERVRQFALGLGTAIISVFFIWSVRAVTGA